MAEQHGTLELVAGHLARAWRRWATRFRASRGSARSCSGWAGTPRTFPPAYAALASTVDSCLVAVDALSDDPQIEEVLALLDAAAGVYRALDDLDTAPAGVEPDEFLADLAERVFELLLVDYLTIAVPTVFNALAALGVIEREYHPATPTRPGFVHNRLRFEVFGEILADPPSLLTRVYGWGTDDLLFDRIARHGAELLQAIGINGVAIVRLDAEASAAYQAVTDPDDAEELVTLRVALFASLIGDLLLEVGFAISELPADASGHAGLILEPLVPDLGGITTTPTGDLQVPLGDRVVMQVRPGIDLSKRVGLVVRPGDVDVQYPFAPGESMPDTGYGVAFAFKPPTPMLLVGAAGASRVEVRKASATFDLDHKEGELEAVAGVSADDVVAVLSGNDFDGFLGGLLGGRDVNIPLKLAVTWSSRTGFRINGGAGFEVGVDPHLAIGPVRADEIRLALRATADTAAAPDLVVETTVAVSAALGPFAFSLSGIGVRLRLAFTAGNAGPFDIDAGFVPPNGVGIKIDSGTVVGGGFLLYDPAHARYAGILQLEVAGLAITAIGLLTTRLPDGTKGYSLLISINADIPPVALGFGFTLEGVGGLIAVNRTIDVDALGRGIKSGSADSVLFPPDPIRDANRIITDLEAIFPPARDRFVFGPMALIAWGSPLRIITAKVGIFIELPVPIRLVLLGQLTALLPHEDLALVELHIDVLGVLDVAKGELAIDASLHDSRITTFPLTGDMALRARWLGDRVLALALGGLHPRFPAPAGFPTLRRLQVELGNGDNPRLTLDAYLAVTSNTVQVGAAFELSAKAAGFNVLGHLGFDALFVLSPFSFEVDVSARVSLRRGSRSLCSISLDFTLSGPRPWRAKGKGSFKILFCSISFRFDISWGDDTPVALPSVDPWPLLREALADARSWAGFLPGEIDTAVSLRADTPPAGVVRVHPAGGLEVRQKVVPLAHKLTQFGGAPPVGPDEYRITRVSLNGSAIDDRADAIDWFAPAQYEALNDADKLSRPSFEQMPAGVRVGGAPVDADAPLVAELKYETVLIDVDFPPWTRPPEPLPLFFVNTMIHSSAAATASIATRGNRRFLDRSQVPALAFGEERYIVMAVDDLTAPPDVGNGEPLTATQAHQLLADYLVAHPQDRARLEVVPASEVPG